MSFALPDSIDEALARVREDGDFSFIAGGTDLLVQRRQGNNTTSHLIDLHRIDELKAMTIEDGRVSLGAGLTLMSLLEHPGLCRSFPTLVQAIRSVASPSIRSSATLGGNLLCQNRCFYFDQSEFWRNAIGYCLKCGGDVCIATGGSKACFSVFISDIAPVLLALRAEIEYVTRDGRKTAALESIYTGDGQRPHSLPFDAIVTRILIPAGGEERCYFRKVRPRESIDFTNLSLSMRRHEDELSVAASGVGPGPAVVHATVDIDPGSLAKKLLSRTQIIDNVAYGRFYRREMLARLVADGMTTLRQP